MYILYKCSMFSGCSGTYQGIEGKLVSDEGRELRNFGDATLQDCKDACDNEDECKSITFSKGGTCYLKDKMITDESYQQMITASSGYTTYYCSKGIIFENC